MVGAGGRIVVPILVQQSIDNGSRNDGVDVGADHPPRPSSAPSSSWCARSPRAPPSCAWPGAASTPSTGCARGPSPTSTRCRSPTTPTSAAARSWPGSRPTSRRMSPVLPVGRHRLAARRHADDRRRHHDARLRLAAGPRGLRDGGAAVPRAAPAAAPARGRLQRRARAQRRRHVVGVGGRDGRAGGAGLRRPGPPRRPGSTGDIRRLQRRRHPRRRAVGAAVPVGRGVLGAHHRRRRRRRRVAGPGVGPHRRRPGRLHVPRVPVPRADRRVHRDPRPDPDRGGRLAAGAGRARHADRDRRAGRRRDPAARTAPHRGRPRHATPTGPGPARPPPTCVPALDRRHASRSSRPTSVAVVGATGSGKTTLAKLLTRLADPTSGRGAHRRASTCATCRWRRCARRW